MTQTMQPPSIPRLQAQLSEASDRKTQEWMEAYLKHVIPFRGLKLPQVRTVLHQWLKAEAFEGRSPEQQFATAQTLIQQEWAEDKLAGILILQEVMLKRQMLDWRQYLPAMAQLFDQGYIQEWNTCDWFCVKVLGPMIKQQGQDCAIAVAAWCEAEVLWRRRASVVSFVNLAKHGEGNFAGFTQLLLGSCAVVVRSPERFAQTGTGWALRQLGVADQATVVQFIQDHAASFSSEGLRYAIEKMPGPLQGELKLCRKAAID
jgi:3-methyladenine DNA glycosylase AlkD